MEAAVFHKFRDLVYEQCGIHLTPGKEALVSARVGKRMRALGMSDYRTYLHHVTNDQSGEEVVQLLDAISTNVTSFFREPAHFTFVNEAMNRWIAQGQRRFRFWSAACSTGEEPYTLAMTLAEIPETRGLDIRILATDISTRVLSIAREGVYEPAKLRDISPQMRERYFQRLGHGQDAYVVRESLRQWIVFKRLNLSVTPFVMKGPMDIILCRNVMIYFDNAVRQKLLAEACRLLRPGGYLMVGHAESLTGMMCSLKTVKAAVYCKAEGPRHVGRE
jgi:chemotaxis protein methyltransferase CheR